MIVNDYTRTIRKMWADGESIETIARSLGMSRRTFGKLRDALGLPERDTGHGGRPPGPEGSGVSYWSAIGSSDEAWRQAMGRRRFTDSSEACAPERRLNVPRRLQEADGWRSSLEINA